MKYLNVLLCVEKVPQLCVMFSYSMSELSNKRKDSNMYLNVFQFSHSEWERQKLPCGKKKKKKQVIVM